MMFTEKELDDSVRPGKRDPLDGFHQQSDDLRSRPPARHQLDQAQEQLSSCYGMTIFNYRNRYRMMRGHGVAGCADTANLSSSHAGAMSTKQELHLRFQGTFRLRCKIDPSDGKEVRRRRIISPATHDPGRA